MKRKWIRVLALLTAVFSMTLALSFPGGAVDLVDLEKDCSLTVRPGVFLGNGKDYLDGQFAKANVVVDLYKVADAVPDKVGGFTYDGYQYALKDLYKNGGLIVGDEMTNEDWEEMAQAAARITLGIGTDSDGSIIVDPVTGVPVGSLQEAPVTGKTINPDTGEEMEDPDGAGRPLEAEIGGLDAGLYLMIARGAGEGTTEEGAAAETQRIGFRDVSAYTAVSKNSEGAEQIVTTANSAECVFSFAPTLISLPGKAAGNTADPGPWLYDMEAALKTTPALRYKSFQIIKELPEFEITDGVLKPVTFIFEIYAVWPDRISGETKEYKDVVALNFTGAGTQNVYRPGEELKLPVGAQVTVTEVYSGSGYQPYPEDVTDEEARRRAYVETKEIDGTEQSFSVTFRNYYNGRNVDGHGITNNFAYSEEEGRWIWTSVHADGTLGGEIEANRTPAENPAEIEGQQPADGAESQ